jgi:seryl-tRNA synthetase
MLDARFVREHIDVIKKSLMERQASIQFDEFLRLEEQRRTLLKEAEELRNKRNVASEEVGRLRKQKQTSRLIEEMKEGIDRIKELDENSNRSKRAQTSFIERPNIPHESVPAGKRRTENVVVRRWGEPRDLILNP